MRSPFSGMDPYIEAGELWSDFHLALITEIKYALTRAVPRGRYFVRTGERAYIVLAGTEGKESRPFLPDVGLTSSRAEKPSSANSPSPATAVEASPYPVALRPFIEEEFKEAFVEIYEAAPDQRLVTCLEVLSPSNKAKGTKGWKKYQRKRTALLLGEVNLVEIDLLRGGTRMPMADPWPASPYLVMVARGQKVPRCLVWGAQFRHPLPDIPVPLTGPDAYLTLNLQALVDLVYERSSYADAIDYSRPLNPPLTPEEVAWLGEQLRASRP